MSKRDKEAAEIRKRATEVEATFRVAPGLYVLGVLERGVTVYRQQVRAHNLAWSLWELGTILPVDRPPSVAIVGGGIAGLTASACLLSLFPNASLSVFEQLWDLCPLQQGADNRWLHPRIYDWPGPGSRAPGASLPVLNWSEGRASDVARQILSGFARYNQDLVKTPNRLTVYLGTQYLRINSATREITWSANRTKSDGTYFHLDRAEGKSDRFDLIILASGFGIEQKLPEYETPSYWRNEQLGQPILDGSHQQFLISGFGDGALTDVCRLTIERFRQDTIVYELFKDRLDHVEQQFESLRGDPKANAFPFFEMQNALLADAVDELRSRIRKDTRVVLHVRGTSDPPPRTFEHVFEQASSFLNRLLIFLLYRCGAITFSLEELEPAIKRFRIPRENVMCRYGSKPLKHLLDVFIDPVAVEARLTDMKANQRQEARRAWQPGTFPPAN
jgi:hypothetical protein